MLLFLVIACGGSSAPSSVDSGSTEPGETAAPPKVEATFVDLELDAFPRPPSESCADRPVTHSVAVGDSIAAALSSASSGDLIEVAPGTYTENAGEWFALEWSVDDLCLRVPDDHAVIEAAPGQNYGLRVTANDVAIEGLMFTGFRTGVALEAGPLENIALERVVVDQMTGDFRDGIGVFGAGTANKPAVDGLLLLDVLVRDADLGVSCGEGPCDHIWLERVLIQNRSSADGSGADAFAVESGRQVVIIDTTIEGAAADGIDIKGTDAVIQRTVVKNVQRNGIKLWQGGDVVNAVVDGSGADAALIGDGAGRYRYAHVLVTNHDPNGSGYVGTWGYDFGGDGMTVEFVNFVASGNSSGGFFVHDDATQTITTSWFEGDQGPVDLNANYGADALTDAGTIIDGLNTDLNGDPRNQGSAPDIGPTESRRRGTGAGSGGQSNDIGRLPAQL